MSNAPTGLQARVTTDCIGFSAIIKRCFVTLGRLTHVDIEQAEQRKDVIMAGHKRLHAEKRRRGVEALEQLKH
jgi:hypothetical protein